MAQLTRLVIFDEKLFRGNGEVVRWCRKVTDRFGIEARLAAPERTGELRAGIRTTTHALGGKQVQGSIRSTAKHTLYVLRGTDHAGLGIYSNRGWRQRNTTPGGYVSLYRGKGASRKKERQRVRGWMRIPPTPDGGFEGGFRWSVRGQEANNFLEKAWRRTARNHKALRNRIPTFILHP